jgi:hypothetical protein
MPSAELAGEFSMNALATQCRILSLDGGGAKGFYSLGVLKEVEAIEAMLGCVLRQRFDLIFGTITGAIIAALIALGRRPIPTTCSAQCARVDLSRLVSEMGGDDHAAKGLQISPR